jgi:hypothetical protein
MSSDRWNNSPPFTSVRQASLWQSVVQWATRAVALSGLALSLLFAVSGCARTDNGKPSPTGNIASDAVHDYGQNVHNSMEAGKKTECQSNLQQLRQAIQIAKDSGDGAPQSLAALGTQYRSMLTCPNSGQPYQYDPASGRVWCVTPGHEKL